MARAEIRAKATLDNSQFKTGIAQMNQGVSRFANGQIKQMAGMIGGAFAVGAVVNFTKEMFNAADAIDNTAKQLGVGVEELQALQRETELTAGSAEKMTGALLKLAKAQANAAAGEISQADAFKDLGISMDQVRKLNPAQLFELISQKVTSAGAVSKEASGASLVLGRSYVELNSVMKKVADEGLRNMTDGMIQANQIMTSDMVVAADRIEEQWNRVFRSITNQARKLALESVMGGGKIQAFVKARREGKSFSEATDIAREASSIRISDTGAKTDASVNPIGADVSTTKAAKTAALPQVQAADQIAKIGGIIGGQSAERKIESTLQSSLEIQKMIKDATLETARASTQTSKNTAPILEG